MFHLAAFTGSMAAGATLATCAALSEQVLTVTGNQFLPDKPYDIIGAYILGASVTAAQLNIPSYRDLSLPYLHPLEVAAAVPNRPNWQDRRSNPFKVRASEPLGLLLSNSAGAPEREYGIIMLSSNGLSPAPAGRMAQVQFTAAITATANAWTAGQLTAVQNLPPGTYTVVGMQCKSATGIAARLIFPNQVARPGILATTGFGNIGILGEVPGALGSWGQFNTTVYPQLEILCSAADTAQTVILDVIYSPTVLTFGP